MESPAARIGLALKARAGLLLPSRVLLAGLPPIATFAAALRRLSDSSATNPATASVLTFMSSSRWRCTRGSARGSALARTYQQ